MRLRVAGFAVVAIRGKVRGPTVAHVGDLRPHTRLARESLDERRNHGADAAQASDTPHRLAAPGNAETSELAPD